MRVGRILAAALTVLLPGNALAQTTGEIFPEGVTLSDTVIQLVVLVGLLGLLPGLIVMITCFPFMVTVLSILRQGIGLQSAPPNMLMIGLALFLTIYVMEPVLLDAWREGIAPFLDGRVTMEEAFPRAMEPFRAFMEARVDFETIERLEEVRPIPSDPGPTALTTLVPAFVLTELSRAFQIGFLVFLPFVVIDLVVAAVLMSMGMMMVPPAIVALPFKLAFFVAADGWRLISEALVAGYA